MSDKPSLDQYGIIGKLACDIERLARVILDCRKTCPGAALEAILEIHSLTDPGEPKPMLCPASLDTHQACVQDIQDSGPDPGVVTAGVDVEADTIILVGGLCDGMELEVRKPASVIQVPHVPPRMMLPYTESLKPPPERQDITAVTYRQSRYNHCRYLADGVPE